MRLVIMDQNNAELGVAEIRNGQVHATGKAAVVTKLPIKADPATDPEAWFREAARHFGSPYARGALMP